MSMVSGIRPFVPFSGGAGAAIRDTVTGAKLVLQRRPGTSMRIDSNNGDNLIVAVEAIQKPRPWETKRCARLRILLQRGQETPKIVSRRAVREGQTVTLPTNLIFLGDKQERAAITFAPKKGRPNQFVITADRSTPVLREELFRAITHRRANDLPEEASPRKYEKWYELPMDKGEM